MSCQPSGSDNFVDDHYVAFLSNGTNLASSPQQYFIGKRRKFASSKVGTRFAKLVAIAIAISVIGGAFILFRSWSNNSSSNLHFIAHNKDSFDTAGGALTNSYIIRSFEEFIAKHGKVYATLEERSHRLETFARNLLFIQLHNSQNFTYSLASNAFADLTFDEFRNRHFTGYRSRRTGLQGVNQENISNRELLNVDPDSLPETFDWRDKGCVSDVKDQRKCGACWAFSAAGAVEGAHCAKYGELRNLSEQQMVDCSGPEGNAGCNGGEMDDAFQYIIDRGGLCTEEAYPYTATEGPCRDEKCKPVVSVTKFVDVPRKSEKALKAAVALKAPVSVAIQANQTPFQFYHSGVFDGSCGKNLNHGVLVVGYGTESGKDYWLVKNSWGTKWGENGFMKLLRDDGSDSGECGILMEPSYAVIQ